MSKVNFVKRRDGILRPDRKGNRRGFTMVELVVALTVISIVTMASIGIMMAHNNIDLQSVQSIEATNIAENAIECFRYAVNVGGDEEGIKKAFYDAFEKTGYIEVEYKDQTEYNFEHRGMNVTIKLEDKTISILANDSKGNQILEKSYTK